MTRRFVFVDGYNVINAWKELSVLDLGNARAKLIEYMVNYGSFYDAAVVVVFDAHRVTGKSEHVERVNNVEVVFTRDGETADGYIERRVDELGRRVEMLVVTSDNLEQQIIFGRGAQRMSSKEFLAAYREAEAHIREQTQGLSDRKALKLTDKLDDATREALEKIRRSN